MTNTIVTHNGPTGQANNPQKLWTSEYYPGERRDLINTLRGEAACMNLLLLHIAYALSEVDEGRRTCYEEMEELRKVWKLIDSYLGGDLENLRRAGRTPGKAQ